MLNQRDGAYGVRQRDRAVPDRARALGLHERARVARRPARGEVGDRAERVAAERVVAPSCRSPSARAQSSALKRWRRPFAFHAVSFEPSIVHALVARRGRRATEREARDVARGALDRGAHEDARRRAARGMARPRCCTALAASRVSVSTRWPGPTNAPSVSCAPSVRSRRSPRGGRRGERAEAERAFARVRRRSS